MVEGLTRLSLKVASVVENRKNLSWSFLVSPEKRHSQKNFTRKVDRAAAAAAAG